jgi:hypothetical protein
LFERVQDSCHIGHAKHGNRPEPAMRLRAYPETDWY